MKKETTQPKSKITTLILLGGVVVTILVTLSVGYFLILPTFTKNSNINQEIEVEKAKTAKIDQSLNLLKSQDKKKIADLALFLNSFIPSELDMLHFATLNEIVAKDAGVQIISIQLTQAKLSLSAKPASSTPAGTATTAKPTTKPAQQTPALAITTTYKSNFEALLKLLNYWFLADQIIGVNNVTITGQSGGIVNYTISYDLPKASTAAKATVDDTLNLTSKQIEKFQALRDKIKYVATPSTHPLGSKNPFQ